MSTPIVTKEQLEQLINEGLNHEQICEKLNIELHTFLFYKKKFLDEKSSIEPEPIKPPTLQSLQAIIQSLTKQLESERIRYQFASHRVDQLEEEKENLELSWLKAQEQLHQFKNMLLISENELSQAKQTSEAMSNLLKILLK